MSSSLGSGRCSVPPRFGHFLFDDCIFQLSGSAMKGDIFQLSFAKALQVISSLFFEMSHILEFEIKVLEKRTSSSMNGKELVKEQEMNRKRVTQQRP